MWKDDKTFWNKATGIKKQYMNTGSLTERKWKEIGLIISPGALQILKETGKGQNYVYHVKKVLGTDLEKGMHHITAAAVKWLKDEIHSGVPGAVKLLVRDVFVVNPDINEEASVGDDELQWYRLQ